MTRFVAAVVLLSAALFPVAIVAETTGTDTAHEEQTRQTSAQGGPFRALLMAIQPKRKAERPAEITFTQSWIDEQPKPDGDAQWRCLSEALYFEARGETVKGQFAVGEVIMNRVKSSRFPATLCGVIKQGTGRKYQCQFTYTCDGAKEVIAEPRAFERVSKVARAILDGATAELTDGATHYHTKSVRPSWARVYTKTAAIGVHIFYRQTYRTASAH